MSIKSRHTQKRKSRSVHARPDLEQEHQAIRLCAEAANALGVDDEAAAVGLLTQALRLAPLLVPALDAQARILGKHGRLDAAIELMQCAIMQEPENAERFLLLARWYARQGKTRMAIAAMHRCVQLEPNAIQSRRYLAALYGTLGNEAYSQFYARTAVRKRAFSVRKSRSESKLTVLALNTFASGSVVIDRENFVVHTKEGHNNLAGLLDNKHITLIRFHVDTLGTQPELIGKLPRADLIYNSITDPERGAHALQLAQQVCDRIGVPVVNEPVVVLASSREGSYERFKEAPGLLFPKSVKYENVQGSARDVVNDALQKHGLRTPLIVRLAGFQGGKYMHLVEDVDDHDFSPLDVKLSRQSQTLYVIQYHDVSYKDPRAGGSRLFPKYRAFMVGDKLYPCHLFTADDFNVHKKNADPIMAAYPWLVEAERDYCADPARHLGAEQWKRLEQAMRQTGLGYNGVDFAPATTTGDKGKIVLFEINPAMRNWVAELPQGDHVQQAWHRITQATHHYFCEVAGVDPWTFDLPKGQAVAAALEIPADVKWIDKQPARSAASHNKAWLAERLSAGSDFSGSPLFNTEFYIDEALLEHTARRRDIRVQRYPGRLLEFTHAGKQVVFHINSPRLPMVVHVLERDKQRMKTLFSRHGIPTPEGRAFSNFREAYLYFASRTCAQAVKPNGGFGSRGVSVHIGGPEQFRAAWQKATQFDQTVLLEDMLRGEELRVYFIDGRHVATTLRVSAYVVGDGRSTIAQLIEKKNVEREKNPAMAGSTIGDTPALDRSGRARSDIPARHEWVPLGDFNIVNQGAEFWALGTALPEKIVADCRKAARLLPTRVCGVDVFVDDLANPDKYWITEINGSTPAISGLFHFPAYGQPIDVASRLLDYAFAHCAQPLNPGLVQIKPARKCQPVRTKNRFFEVERLQLIACLSNLPVQRPTDHALLIGSPTQFVWTDRMSCHTSIESIAVLKNEEWWQHRLRQSGVSNRDAVQGTIVRVLVAGEHLVAAHEQRSGSWHDVTDHLHVGVAHITAQIMHALYRPGHALVTLDLSSFRNEPLSGTWSIRSIDLQPDLSVFYLDVDQPRDVLLSLFMNLMPTYKDQAAEPIAKQLQIKGKVQGVGYGKWLHHEVANHALQARIVNVDNGDVEAVVHGQPNAIEALIQRCHAGPRNAEVQAVVVSAWTAEAPKGIEIVEAVRAE